MLHQLRLQGFKSFIDEAIQFDRMTLLVGANAAGKSNVLDAIRLLQGLAMDMTIGDVLRGRWEGGRQTWPGIRGGAADVQHRDADEVMLRTEWRTESSERVTHEIGFEAANHSMLSREKLVWAGKGQYLYDTNAPALRDRAGRDGANIRVALKRTGKGNSPTQAHTANRSLLQQVVVNAPVSPLVPAGVDVVLQGLRRAYFYDVTPARMREYVPQNMSDLGLEGENVSALTWTLCQDEEEKADLVDWLTELCAPELEDIQFAETELGDVMLVLVERNGRRIPARSLSDGTLRFLGQLIALRTAEPGSLLLMEEIENGLHPTRAHLLVEAMQAAAEARRVQVVATTHSPLVLNALSPDALQRAVLVARPPGSDGSLLRRLSELDNFREVERRTGIDRMVSSGWLERAV